MRTRTLLHAALVLTCAFFGGAAALDVAGTITTTTWTKANSPYRVTGEIVVPAGETLTIEPGVDVLFDANVRFFVQGTLAATGTETDSIRFIAGSSPVWNRLVILDGAADMRYVRISHARAIMSETESNGGGIASYRAVSLTIDHCVISNNVAEGDGGGLAVGGVGTATITRTTICDNVAGYNGGGLTVAGEILFTMRDCLIARNNGGLRGGGINATHLAIQHLVENCTIAGNIASSGSGVWAKYGAVLTLKNCIVWGNTPNPATFTQLEGVVNASYSDIEIPAGSGYHPTSVMGKMAADVYAGVGNINADPQFLMPAAGNYRLATGSPCIDAGDPATPNDVDGTRADMGVRPGSGSVLPGALFTFISTDTTWVKSTGPFHVSKPVIVATGATLTIEPGVDVLFDAPVQMVVRGRLEAIGAAEDSIRFLPGLSPMWGGLRFASGDSSTLAFVRVSGAGNTADGVGGVFVTGAGTRLRGTGVVISGNEAAISCGGGLVSSGALLDLSSSLVCQNRATGVGGGLVAGTGATLLLDHCDIIRNETTANDGGGLHLGSVTAVITGSTITGNRAGRNSGGIRLVDADLTLVNCLIAGNNASKYGGGIWMSDGSTAQIENCTITDNTGIDANTPAGGIGVWASSARLKNTIIWGNKTRDIDQGGGGIILASYCDLGVTYGGTGNINADPLFVDPASQNFRLQNSSPCIDAGDPSSPKDPDGTRADMGMRPFDPTLTVESPRVPLRFLVMQNAPNPFNPVTTIRFALPEAGHVTLAVYDVRGVLVRTLADRSLPAGAHAVVWDGYDTMGREVASGVYVYRLTAAQGVVTRRMVLAR
ncbi:MAG TPA: right-handed parallel beta-helix repeat-containing protein [Candidatus Latescibacteria bacterium]|nr:right-handed parallel beta-helix repeat-containing protein [Candidatus Latescibacterota bacterium]HPK75574.1 right-handed parallel beta-helix repeat-containing protein [Candidatus Latescibacterota bacterium]